MITNHSLYYIYIYIYIYIGYSLLNLHLVCYIMSFDCMMSADLRMRRLSGVALLVTISVCLGLSIICHIVALSTRHWIESTSSAATDQSGTFLNLGLWTACFSNYQHRHELTARRYDGCYSLYSDYYANIRDWLIPRQSTFNHYNRL